MTQQNRSTKKYTPDELAHYNGAMGKNYSLAKNVALPNSSSLPIATLIGSASVRPELYDILMGCSDPADSHEGRFSIIRCSTTGTPGSSPSPVTLDPGDPATSQCTAGLAIFTVGPTPGVVLLQWGAKQDEPFRFATAPNKEFKGAYVANNGLAFMNPTVDTAYTLDFTLQFHE